MNDAAARVQMAADLDVLDHGEIAEQLDELEGADQPVRRDPFRRRSGDVLAVEA